MNKRFFILLEANKPMAENGLTSPILTKSKYLLGLQCKRLLWIAVHQPERMLKPDKMAEYRFEVGNEIGKLATSLFKGGIDLSNIVRNEENALATSHSLKERKTIFEAGFQKDNLFARIDILNPTEDGKWDIIEVKSGSNIKDYNLDDVAFQRYVCESTGLKIDKCFILHLNKNFVKQGRIDVDKLLFQEDVTKEVDLASKYIGERISNMFKVLEMKSIPDLEIEELGLMEFDNVVQEEFFKSLPLENVFDLYFSGKKSRELYSQGIIKISDIPEGNPLTPRQLIQFECSKTKVPYVNKEKISKFIDKLQYPLYFLDFETMSLAVPKFDGTSPYQQIPFQYSLHIKESPESKLKHIGFLYFNGEDPRKALMQSLKENMGEEGSIIVWNESFEKGRLKECYEFLEEYKEFVEKNLFSRIVDMLVPFRDFDYYNPKQEGSASIKKVLPVFSNLSYTQLSVQQGDIAGIEYVRAMYSKIDEEERTRIRLALEAYCELDTLAEVEILEGLKRLVT